MRAPKRYTLFALAVSTLLGARALDAAVIRTTSGSEIAGEIETPVFHLRTATGDLEIPVSVVLQATRTADGFRVLLGDGNVLEGTLAEQAIRVKVGLVYQLIQTREIDVLMLTPPGFEVGSLTSNYLPADSYKGTEEIEACPIRFELDATAHLGAQKGVRRQTPKVRYFTCDSLSLLSLEISAKRGKKQSQITVEGVISVRESFDKWARVTAEFLAGKERLARGQKAAIDAEERKNTPFRLEMTLPTSRFDEALGSGATIQARITVDVGKNGDVEYLQQWGVPMKGPKYENQASPPP